MTLIEDWKEAWRWVSVQIMLASSAILATWALLPEEFKAYVPDWAMKAFLIIMLLAGIGGRLLKQRRKPKPSVIECGPLPKKLKPKSAQKKPKAGK